MFRPRPHRFRPKENRRPTGGNVWFGGESSMGFLITLLKAASNSPHEKMSHDWVIPHQASNCQY